MTALVLPRLWLPRFEPWRLLKPLKIDGQFHPGQAIQFVDNEPGALRKAAGGVADIEITDDGDAAPSSGTGTNTHTYNSQSSTGPDTILFVTWEDGSTLTLNSATWGGVSMDILIQQDVANNGCAILYISGAQSGNIVLNFSGNMDDSHITKASLSGLQSATPIDTDVAALAGPSNSLDALSSPGAGGIRLACASAQSTFAFSWTNAVELSDVNAGAFRHSAAYDLGDDGSAISASVASASFVMAGASMR